MDALNCLKTRRSVRDFAADTIDRSILQDIAECGRLAASANNIQPVHIVIVTDPKTRKAIADLTSYGKFIADAPACMVVISEDTKYFLEDGSAATQNILLAAKAHGLGSCWVAGNKKEYDSVICTMLGAPEGCKLISLVALGKACSVPSPSKKPLQQVVHWDKF
jgi:nitroreductase